MGTGLARPAAPNVGEQLTLTAKMIKDGSGLQGKFAEFLCEVIGIVDKAGKADISALKEFVKVKSGISSFIDGILALSEAYKNLRSGKKREGVADLLIGLGKIWGALPSNLTNKAIDTVKNVLSKIDKIKPLVRIVAHIAKIGGLGPFLVFLGGVIKWDRNTATGGAKDFVKVLKDNPQSVAAMAPDLIELLFNLIPERMRTKLLAKMGGRKVPVVGTIIVGVIDIWELGGAAIGAIRNKKNEAGVERWDDVALAAGGLGSTIAGLFPGIGTAASVVIDIAALVYTIIQTMNEFQANVQAPKFKSIP